MVAFGTSLDLPYDGAHVDDEDISWISNNTSKYHGITENRSTMTGTTECWTIISTKSFGKAFKVPQENIPPRTEKSVVEKLLVAFKAATGKQELPALCYTRVQLWGAAVPINTLASGSDCVFDGRHHLGVCGDWLSSPCIQGAAISGLSVAEKIQQFCTGRAHG
jgi:predicted NAD/FAD-dependent oxidoreductase